MGFRELEYISVIAQERNISKAAERLFVSQPALSRALLKIEEDVGTVLFYRRNRQYIPTHAGELYLKMAREILAIKKDFNLQIKKMLESKGGILKFGITPGRARTIIPKILPYFHKVFPNYELQIFEEDVVTLEKYLDEGVVELAFFTMTDKIRSGNNRIVYELLAKEEVVLCTANTSVYSFYAEDREERRYPWLDLKLMENETFILLKENMRLGQFAVDILEKNKLTPQTMRLSSIDTALALVAQQYGVAFASSFRIEEHESAKDIHIFSIGEYVNAWDFVVAYQKDFRVDKPVQYIIELIKGLIRN